MLRRTARVQRLVDVYLQGGRIAEISLGVNSTAYTFLAEGLATNEVRDVMELRP